MNALPTILSFLSGRQITNNSGVPQAGAKLKHYRATTTTALTVWQDAGATIPYGAPAGVVTADAGGFVPLIYVDDTFDWKVVITTSADVVLQTYDNLPKAESDASDLGFAPPLLTWTQVTSSASPVALTVNDVGKAYEADTTGGNIEFDLPDAASVGNGKGFVFKKTASANSMIIDPSGSQTIDDVSASLTVVAKDTLIGIYSNGAEWYVVEGYGLYRIINNLTEDTAPDSDADFVITYDTSAGTEKKVKPALLAGSLIAIIEDQKASNTDGGTFTSGADQTRTLNTLVFNRNSLVTLSSNQFILPAGDWEIEWSAPAGAFCGSHQTILRDVTGGADLARGSSEFSSQDSARGDVISRSVGNFRHSPSASNTYEIRHRCSNTTGGTGFGDGNGFGTEVYTRVIIRAC